MKLKIFRNWSVVRVIWLVMGIAVAVSALIVQMYLLLVPALYFVLGAIANVGCFADSCAVKPKNPTNPIQNE
jgi:hypothetical protein